MSEEQSQTNCGPSRCYAESDLGKHIRQLIAYVRPEVDGELVECEIVLKELEAIDRKATMRFVCNGKSAEEWYTLYCQQQKVEDAAAAVLNAAMIGDQNFIWCLCGDHAAELRRALVKLQLAIRDA